MDWRIVREHPSSLCFEGGVHHNASLSSGPWMSCRTEPERFAFCIWKVCEGGIVLKLETEFKFYTLTSSVITVIIIGDFAHGTWIISGQVK